MYQAHAQELLNQKEAEAYGYPEENPNDPQTHPIDAATYRLVTALDRLESNLRHMSVDRDRGTRQHQQLMMFEQENQQLRIDRENLGAAVSQLQRQYNALHTVAASLYAKLDDSIKKLTDIIEN